MYVTKNVSKVCSTWVNLQEFSKYFEFKPSNMIYRLILATNNGEIPKF